MNPVKSTSARGEGRTRSTVSLDNAEDSISAKNAAFDIAHRYAAWAVIGYVKDPVHRTREEKTVDGGDRIR